MELPKRRLIVLSIQIWKQNLDKERPSFILRPRIADAIMSLRLDIIGILLHNGGQLLLRVGLAHQKLVGNILDNQKIIMEREQQKKPPLKLQLKTGDAHVQYIDKLLPPVNPYLVSGQELNRDAVFLHLLR